MNIAICRREKKTHYVDLNFIFKTTLCGKIIYGLEDIKFSDDAVNCPNCIGKINRWEKKERYGKR